MNNSEERAIRYVNRMPPELIRYIKQYLPITLLKKVRRIHENEFPFQECLKNLYIYTVQTYIQPIKNKIKQLNLKYF